MQALLLTAPAHPNPSIESCLQAARAAHAEALAQQKQPHECETLFREAFAHALPDLATREGVCAFVACVGYGMTNDLIYHEDARRFLYAAQVALCAVPRLDPKSRCAA